MRIQLLDAAVGAGAGAEVPPLTLAIAPGSPVVIPVETDERPRLVSLLIGGRLRPTAGSVLADGRADAAALRRRVALVDTPFTAEPHPRLALRTVVAEELAFAGRPAGRRRVQALLERQGISDAAVAPVGLLATAARIRLLVELALLREDVGALVLTSPERHGGDPRDWFPAVAGVADRGIAVAVVTDLPTASILDSLGAVRTAPNPDSSPAPTPDQEQ